jgi:DNA-binding GntR family transcriptional regulator
MPRQAPISPDPEPGFLPVAGETLPELASTQIYRAIIEGRQPPGSHVPEAAVARAMGLSRGPVREGLRLLERKGLVVFHARRGFFVRNLTTEGLDDLFAVRRMLEQHAIKAAIARGGAEAFASLLDWRARLLKADRSGPPVSPAVLVEEDLALHATFCRLSGNTSLIAAFEVVLAETRLALSVVNLRLGRLSRVVSHHAALLDAVLARDAAAAKRELDSHLEASCASIKRRLAQMERDRT